MAVVAELPASVGFFAEPDSDDPPPSPPPSLFVSPEDAAEDSPFEESADVGDPDDEADDDDLADARLSFL